MIKPNDIIKQIDPNWDIRYFTHSEFGKGGFGFRLQVKGEFGMGIRRQIEGRACRLTIEGQYNILGTIKPQKTLRCNIRVWVDPTSENANDGYCYTGWYSDETDGYIYTDYAGRLVSGMLSEICWWWANEDRIRGEVPILDGSMHLNLHRNLKIDDWFRQLL